METATEWGCQADEERGVEGQKEALDAQLWSRLQDYIPLYTVYQKLPVEDRLRLRVVCKTWNQCALGRLELKPYFAIIGSVCTHGPQPALYFNGVMKYDAVSGKCSFERQPFPLFHPFVYSNRHGYLQAQPMQVEGLILCWNMEQVRCMDQVRYTMGGYDYELSQVHKMHTKMRNITQFGNYMGPFGVYSIHTKLWHMVPPAPWFITPVSVLGMMVDTSERPYSFKLVVGTIHRETQIYDSRSRVWRKTSSIMLLSASAFPLLHYNVNSSCVWHDGSMYISIGLFSTQMILVYSMKEDNWSTLDLPNGHVDNCGTRLNHSTLAIWEGRIFMISDYDTFIVVWELVDLSKQEWAEYGRCSEEEYERLFDDVDYDFDYVDCFDVTFVRVFCDEYLLLYSWLNNGPEMFLMFNLKTKKWTTVWLPKGTLSAGVEVDYDYEGDVRNKRDGDEDDGPW